MEFSTRILGLAVERLRCSAILQAQEGYATEKLFWTQFGMAKRPLLLNEQMAQCAELLKISSCAMKDVVVRLRPTERVPNSYFGLVQ